MKKEKSSKVNKSCHKGQQEKSQQEMQQEQIENTQKIDKSQKEMQLENSQEETQAEQTQQEASSEEKYNGYGLRTSENQTDGIYKQSKGKMLKRMIIHAKPIMPWLALSAFIMACSVALSVIAPLLLGLLTDAIYNIESGIVVDWAEVVTNSISLAVVYFLSSALGAANLLIMNRVVSRFYTCRLRTQISEKIQRLPVSFVDNTPKGEIMSRMNNDISHMGSTIHNILHLTIRGAFQLISITVIMFTINPYMALLVLVLIPISLVLSAIIVNKSEKIYRKERREWGQLHSFIEEDYSGFDTVKAYNLEKTQREKFGLGSSKMKEYSIKAQCIGGRVTPVIQFTNNLAYVGICVLGGVLAIKGSVSVGDVVAITVYARLFSAPLESIAQGLNMLQRAFASARRVYELLEYPEMENDAQEKPVIKDGCVKMENVCFSYNKSKKLIQDLNIDVKGGQKVAIVGPTGGGKTTIVNLLMRFYDVDSGRILIDGVDISKMSREDVRGLFAMVLQDTWLYSGTIYQNIAYARPDCTYEQVMEAAKSAHIDDFIMSLPDGYDTVINEESTNISSGQKQLLTIARAYLADKQMLILDEATSNVDTRTELLIQETMDRLMKHKTSFVIAHRLSTIVDADIILVVDNGRIVEKGNHTQLLAAKGLYSEIYNSQYDLLSTASHA